MNQLDNVSVLLNWYLDDFVGDGVIQTMGCLVFIGLLLLIATMLEFGRQASNFQASVLNENVCLYDTKRYIIQTHHHM